MSPLIILLIFTIFLGPTLYSSVRGSIIDRRLHSNTRDIHRRFDAEASWVPNILELRALADKALQYDTLGWWKEGHDVAHLSTDEQAWFMTQIMLTDPLISKRLSGLVKDHEASLLKGEKDYKRYVDGLEYDIRLDLTKEGQAWKADHPEEATRLFDEAFYKFEKQQDDQGKRDHARWVEDFVNLKKRAPTARGSRWANNNPTESAAMYKDALHRRSELAKRYDDDTYSSIHGDYEFILDGAGNTVSARKIS